MAWFTPPLTKPGNHRCPNCHRGLLFHVSWGSSWRCPKCQSLLRWDWRRHVAACLLAFLVYCADTAAITLWPHRPEDSVPVTGLVGILTVAIVTVLFIFWWMASISPVEEQGPAHSLPAPDKPPGTK